MVAEVRTQQVTIPAGTAQVSPQVTAAAFPSRVVSSVDLVFPPGCHGQVGCRLTMNGDAVLPIDPAMWLVADGETIRWDVQGYPDSGAWQLTAYNTGQYAHTIYLRWGLDYLAQPAPPAMLPLPASALTGTLGGI